VHMQPAEDDPAAAGAAEPVAQLAAYRTSRARPGAPWTRSARSRTWSYSSTTASRVGRDRQTRR
jgi:hypothetical protein